MAWRIELGAGRQIPEVPFVELRASGRVEGNRGGVPLMLSLSKHRRGFSDRLLGLSLALLAAAALGCLAAC
jgi:hypothetical protein